MIGLPSNLSLSSTDTTDQTSNSRSGDSSGGSGLRSAVVNNFSQGGSRLDSGISDASGKPSPWLWAGLIGAGAFFVWYAWNRKG